MPNIVVLVKRVPDTNARIVINGDRVDLSAVKWVISPYDEFAIETALQHKEAAGGTVTAVTLGPSESDKILKDAKAIGVDDIVRVWDDSWGELDSNAIQSALANAISEIGAEVVYCGKTAADTSSPVIGDIWPLFVSAITILSLISSPQITFASSLRSFATSSAEFPPLNIFPSGFAGGEL